MQAAVDEGASARGVWRVNLLVIAGIAVALVPLFESWFQARILSGDYYYAHRSILWILQNVSVSNGGGFLMGSAILFLVGLLLSAVTPLGFLGQIGGVAWLVAESPFKIGLLKHATGIFDATPSYGAALGALSATLIALGIIFPYGIDMRMKVKRLEERLLTVQRG